MAQIPFFPPDDHRRVARATAAVERLFKGDVPENRLQGVSAEHLLPVRGGFYEEDLPSPDDFDHPTSAWFRTVAPSKSNPRASVRVKVTNRDSQFAANKGNYGQVMQVGDEWHPTKGEVSCIKAGWLDEDLTEFGTAAMTVASWDSVNEAWCETNESIDTVIDFVGIGDTLVEDTGVLAMPLCNSDIHVLVSAPCVFVSTRPILVSGGNGGCLLASGTAGAIQMSG